MRRKGLGYGMGRGFKNLIPVDSFTHSLSARGIKSYNKQVIMLQKRVSVLDDKKYLKLTKRQKNEFTDLPIEQRIIVPSTKNKRERLTRKEFSERVETVKKWFTNRFGGHTTVQGIGGFDNEGNVIEEDVAVVTSFSTVKDFEKHGYKVPRKLQKWAKDWGQFSVSYEFEGDLYLVPPAGKK